MMKKLKHLLLAGTLACASIPLLAGCSNMNGDIQVRVDDGYVQWSEDGKEWKNVISVDDVKSTLGETYKGDKGDKGDTGAQGEQGIQGIQGEQGVAGREVEFQTTEDYIQWRYVGDTTWQNLIAKSELKGEQGIQGAPGEIGPQGPAGQDASAVTYTITFDYIYDGNDYSSLFINTSNYTIGGSSTIEIPSNKWLLGYLPQPLEKYYKYFKGWFIKGGDNWSFSQYNHQIQGFDFIGENVKLICKWDISEAFNDGISFPDKFCYNCTLDGNIAIIDKTKKQVIVPKLNDENYITTIAPKYPSYQEYPLEDIILPSTLTTIRENTFIGCVNLDHITLPNGVTSIEENAFYGCNNLLNISLPDTVTSIAPRAFAGCKKLTSIIIPNGVTSIYVQTFNGCQGLTSIMIGSEITNIDDYAFLGCSNLTSINYVGTMDQWNTIEKGSNWDQATGDYTIHCTDGDIAKDGTIIE